MINNQVNINKFKTDQFIGQLLKIKQLVQMNQTDINLV